MLPSDSELLACIRRQDAAAFEILMARYREALRRHLRGIVRDPGATEDLVQEIGLRVWTRADQWDGRGAVRAWLFRIATNLALNHLRTIRRRCERPLEPAGEDPDEDAFMPAWMVDAAAQEPAQEVERAERDAALRRIVEDLPPDKREVLRMVYDWEMDLREVAERLDIPEGTVKSRLYHARKQLAERWNAFENEGEDLL